MCRRHPALTYLTPASLVLMVLVAGCTGVPIGPERQQGPNVTFVGNNTEDTPVTFEVFVVDVPANITIVRSDGIKVESDIGQGVGSAFPGEGFYYTEVTPDPQATTHHGNFTVDAGGEVRSTITTLLQYGAVVVVVYDEEGRITSYVEANCDDLALTYLGLTTDGKQLVVTSSCS